MKTKIFIILLLSTLLSSVSAETIELLGEDNYPPFSNSTQNGLSNQVITAAYQAVGINIKFIAMPFARVTKYVLNNRALGGFNIIKVSGAENDFLFPQNPIYQVHTHYYFNTDSSFEIKKSSDLDNKNLLVGQVIGFMYSPEFYQRLFTRHEAQSEQQLINMLWIGRIDSAYITREAEFYYRKKLNIPDKAVYFLPAIGAQEVPLYLAFNKHHPKAKHYAEKFDDGIRIIKENGQYQKIIKSFFPFN